MSRRFAGFDDDDMPPLLVAVDHISIVNFINW